jgi:hypothetical protein
VGGVVRDTNYGKEVNTMSDELTVTNACYQCMIQMELCPDCSDLRDSRATDIAHDMVDEGNLIYSSQWHSVTEPSGHEWVSSTTRVEPYFSIYTLKMEDTREEYLEAVSLITDRLFDLNADMPANSIVCQACHYTYNKHAQCPNCN